MQRRNFIRLAGGGVVLAAGAGLSSGCTGFAVPDSAVAAWQLPAANTELRTEATMMESMRLLRVGSTEIDQHRDGITINSPLLVALVKTGLFDRSRMPAPDGSATTRQVQDFDAVTASTPTYLWLVTEGNQRQQQIAAGRAYLRINLAATALGLALHPNEQALQEYPEMAALYAAIHTLLDAPAPQHTVQMLARLGHLPAGSAAAPPAPRRGLARHLVA